MSDDEIKIRNNSIFYLCCLIRPGSYFSVPIRPHLVQKWLQVDFKSTACTQNDLRRLGQKATDFRLLTWRSVVIFDCYDSLVGFYG